MVCLCLFNILRLGQEVSSRLHFSSLQFRHQHALHIPLLLTMMLVKEVPLQHNRFIHHVLQQLHMNVHFSPPKFLKFPGENVEISLRHAGTSTPRPSSATPRSIPKLDAACLQLAAGTAERVNWPDPNPPKRHTFSTLSLSEIFIKMS